MGVGLIYIPSSSAEVNPNLTVVETQPLPCSLSVLQDALHCSQMVPVPNALVEDCQKLARNLVQRKAKEASGHIR